MHERIPIYLALVISGLFPAAVIAVYTLFIDGFFSHHRRTTHTRSKYSFHDRLWELNCGWLGLLLAQGAAFVITGSLKNLCGKPRPDLIDRCQPREGSADRVPAGLVTKAICTQEDEAIMQDGKVETHAPWSFLCPRLNSSGFRSFPSGHSSSSFAGLFFLSLYLAAKLHILDQKGEVWRTLVVLVPTLAASCVAMSRIMDARHHPFDVLFGSALGILCAWGAYRQYFPPVSHTWEKGRAYPMRSWGTPVKRPVPGKVMIDSDTLEVLDDRVPAADDDDEEAHRFEMDVNAAPVSRRQGNPNFPSHRTDRSLDMDAETGYAGLSQGRQQFSSPQGPIAVSAALQPSSSGNAFRDQLEQNRRMRAGHTGTSPEREHNGSEDEDDIALRRPLHSARAEA